MSNAPSKPVSFSRPKVGYFSNRPRIYALNGLICSKIDMSNYCKDQDIEICMLKMNFMSVRLHILVVCRAATGDFNFFLNQLDYSIKSIYKTNLNLIICGDININYLLEYDMKKQLDSMLQTYNLTAVVHFPTRVQDRSCTMIDNIFLDILKIPTLSVLPFFDGLSDHDAQFLSIVGLKLHNLNSPIQEDKIYTSLTMWCLHGVQRQLDLLSFIMSGLTYRTLPLNAVIHRGKGK